MVTQNAAFINGVLLLEAHRQVFSQERGYPRAIALVIAEVFAFRQHRVTDLRRALGLVETDWGAWYRLFQQPGRFMAELAGGDVAHDAEAHRAKRGVWGGWGYD